MTAAGVVLAQADQADLTGWWVGIGIGVLIVAVVALLVVALIVLAERIARQARRAAAALDAAEVNTRGLWDVAAVNREALAVLEGTVRARHALEDAS